MKRKSKATMEAEEKKSGQKSSKAEKERLKAAAEADRDPRWSPQPGDKIACPGRWTVLVRAAGGRIYGLTEPDTDPMPFQANLRKFRELYHRPEAVVLEKRERKLGAKEQPKFTPAPPPRPPSPRKPKVPGPRKVGTKLN